VSRPGLCPPRGQAIKGADPQGWSAKGGEAEGGRLRWLIMAFVQLTLAIV